MCFVCCAAFAFVYESGSGRYLEEGYGSSGFGSGSGSEHDGPDYPTGTERIVYFLDPNDDSDILYEEKHSDGFTIDLSLPKYQAVASPKTPTHYHYSGWTNTSLEDVTTVTLNGSDITLYVKWSKNRTNIFFIDDSGTTKQTYEYNDVVVAPTPATRIGYTANWDNNLPAVVADTNNRDFDSIYVNAIYTINTWALYKVVNGVTTKVDDVAYNTVITSSILPDPSVTGYTFAGWQNFPSDGKMPNNDLTVIANLSVNHHNVTWIYQDTDGNSHTLLPEEGTEYSSANVAYNTSLVQPTISLPSGWVMNWTYDGQSISGMTMPDSDITITGIAESPDYVFSINETDSIDPVTLTYSGINAYYEPVGINSSNELTVGDWGNFINEMFTPVMLNYDGTEAYELSRTNLSKRADGVTDSDINNTNFRGNAMVRVKKIYSKITKNDKIITFRFSFVKKDNNYHAYGFIGNDGLERDYAYVGMFESSKPNSSGSLRSISEQNIIIASNNGSYDDCTINFVSDAKSQGNGYDITPYIMDITIRSILVMVTKKTNLSAFYGITNPSDSTATQTDSSSGSMGNNPNNGFIFPSENKLNEMVFWMEGLVTGHAECITGITRSAIATQAPYDLNNTSSWKSISMAQQPMSISYYVTSMNAVDGVPYCDYIAASSYAPKYYCQSGVNTYSGYSGKESCFGGFHPIQANQGKYGLFSHTIWKSGLGNGTIHKNSTARLYFLSHNNSYNPPSLMMSAPRRQQQEEPEEISMEPLPASDTADIATESEEIQ